MFSAFFPPSTSAFCIASAKTVYSIMCLQEEIVWRPDFIFIKRSDLGKQSSWCPQWGIIDSSLQPPLPKPGLPGIVITCENIWVSSYENVVCAKHREPRGTGLLSCLIVIVSWTLIRCAIKEFLGAISFTGV